MGEDISTKRGRYPNIALVASHNTVKAGAAPGRQAARPAARASYCPRGITGCPGNTEMHVRDRPLRPQ